VRVAILLSVAACGLASSAARADQTLIKITLETGPAYIVPEEYAADHKAELKQCMPGVLKIEGFWTPTETDVIVADRVFRQLIRAAAKDPTILFPELVQNPDATAAANIETAAQLQNERYELSLVSDHFDRYARQYVGVILEGKKLVFCNYAVVPKADASADFLFIQKVFAADGTVHFLQSRVDPDDKSCANVSIIGSWQRSSD
jgi:hypothetical protein